jgi:hypothetical protein
MAAWKSWMMRLPDVRRNWESNLPDDEDPESYIQPFSDLLAALEREFSHDTAITSVASEQTILVQKWVDDTMRNPGNWNK